MHRARRVCVLHLVLAQMVGQVVGLPDRERHDGQRRSPVVNIGAYRQFRMESNEVKIVARQSEMGSAQNNLHACRVRVRKSY
jgi:hypothetical protein